MASSSEFQRAIRHKNKMAITRKTGSKTPLTLTMADDAATSTLASTSATGIKEKQQEEESPSPSPSSAAQEDDDDDMKDDDVDDNKIDEEGGAIREVKREEEEKPLTEEEKEAKKKRDAELKEKYKDWPMKNIKDPHQNDVMYGRGGGTNHHPGNKRYRKMVEDRKLEYVNSKRLDKPLVALEIIREWRSQVPPGRFLKLDEKTGLWHDVGDKKAREKTSQALREKAPLLRQQHEGEQDDSDDKGDGTKTTRFAVGTKKEDAKQVKKAVLARDHSLGREYIEPGEAVTLDGFSWQEPFQTSQRETSYGRHIPPPPPNAYPAGRNSSHGSLGMAPPHHVSIGGPPPPPDYWGGIHSNERQREFSNGRYESWGSASYGYPLPPPAEVLHQRSGSWTHGPPPPPGRHSHHRSGSWGSGREHSLGMFPLIGATVADRADPQTFNSGRSWRDPGSPGGGVMPSPPPPPGGYGGDPMRSSGSLGPYRQPLSPSNSTPSPKPYNVDLNIAKTWSGGEVQPTWPDDPRPSIKQTQTFDGYPKYVSGGDAFMIHGPNGAFVPRPDIVKRDTSHQNENYETKHSVKRAALNRDNSLASNRLKEEYMPEYFLKKFDAEHEMQTLSTNLEHSTLDAEAPKPQALGESQRVSTFDTISMDLMAKPAPMLKGDRMNTIDVLDLDLETDSFIRETDSLSVDVVHLPKPKSLEPDDRLTTKDLLDLVNSPLAQDDDNAPQIDDSDDPLQFNQEKIADEWLT